MERRTSMTLKQFRTRYKCCVNPRKRKVWSYKKNKLEKWSPSMTVIANQKMMPVIGFICEECGEYNNYSKLYFVNKKAVHEECGLKLLTEEKLKGLKEV